MGHADNFDALLLFSVAAIAIAFAALWPSLAPALGTGMVLGIAWKHLVAKMMM